MNETVSSMMAGQSIGLSEPKRIIYFKCRVDEEISMCCICEVLEVICGGGRAINRSPGGYVGYAWSAFLTVNKTNESSEGREGEDVVFN